MDEDQILMREDVLKRWHSILYLMPSADWQKSHLEWKDILCSSVFGNDTLSFRPSLGLNPVIICNILSSWRKCSVKPKEHKTQIFNTLIFTLFLILPRLILEEKKLLGIQFWTRLSSNEVTFRVGDNSIL